ncbi:MAG: glycosyltransferase family 2 protein [Candidatus Binatia bacterium]
MKKDTLVSVIIPVFNGEKTLKLCLESVFQSEGSNCEVIVVDDHSTDHSAGIARQFPCRVLGMESNSGAAAARNRGVEIALGELLFFLDADIVIEKNTIQQIVETFHRRPDISALFCSYQKHTLPSNFFSLYKNLVHHYTHQTSRVEAATFCGGFGAIRREVFLEFHGFDESRRNLEDIELGYRLHQSDHKIYLNKEIQVTHCKHYSLLGLLQSDVLHRAIPWTTIMLEKKIFRNDLNTKINNVLSIPLVFLLLLTLSLLPFFPPSRVVFVLLVGLLLLLNYDFYVFVLREKGAVFTAKTIVMHWCTYLYSGVGLLIGFITFLTKPAPKPTRSYSP